VAVRRQQRDISVLAQATRDFNDRQSQIFVVIASFLLHYAPPDLHGVIDDDVAEATAALASTYETGVARGDLRAPARVAPGRAPGHRTAPGPHRRPARARPRRSTATPASCCGGSRKQVRDVRATDHDNSRAFLDLLVRVLPKTARRGPAGI
jgi:hypothetical protein